MPSTTAILFSALLASSSLAQSTFQTSSKRGLVFVNNPKAPEDNKIWPPPGTDLTWYYNYQPSPSPVYAGVSQADFEFVPMCWGPSSTFLNIVKAQIDGGRNITHVMGFNEPDEPQGATGGSGISPMVAAQAWIDQIEPLRKLGVKTGAPAVTGSPRGITWLENFFNSCAELGTNCTIDFLPLHWYGDFGGLASHMGQLSAAYPNMSMWITEYAFSHQELAPTQDFFKMSAEYFDRMESVGRYSYFGSFRSSISNVGKNAAMLDAKGQLTDIGAWYLGRAATGNIPSSAVRNDLRYNMAGAFVMAVFFLAL